VHAALSAALFAVNAYLIAELFHREFIDQTGSIEAAYISLARYISENWRDLTWFPLWYNGIPFQDSYPPLLHLLSAFTASLFNIPPGTAYHAVCAVLFSLGPVTLYAFAVRCGASITAAFLAALAYTVVSPSALLVEPIYADLGRMIAGRRLQDLVAWGEGPHVSGLTFFPLALLLLDLAWHKASPRYDLLAAAAMAATALTNWHAALTLALGVACWLLPNCTRPRILRTAWIGILAYALAALWIPPSTIAVVRANARVIGGNFDATYAALPIRALLALALFAAATWLLRRMRIPPIAQFAIFFSTITAAFTLGAYWYGVKLVPQPERYHLQMEMGLCLLAGLALAALLRRTPRIAQAIAISAILLACITPIRQVRRISREIHLRPLNMRNTIYGQLGRWLRANDYNHRIYAPGAKTAWLNAFCDTPQFDGGFAQGLVNLKLREAWHYINLARTQEETVLWARVFGIHAILASLPRSPDPYKPLNYPEKLNGLQPLWQGEGETLYRIPHRSTSLARIVPIDALPPSLDQVTTYVNALEDPALPEAPFHWTSRHSGVIEASLHPHQAVSLQWTYHPGWHATVNGAPSTLREDGIGHIALEPGCDGPCRIELHYDGGWEIHIARTLPWLALLTLLRRARRK